MIHARQVTLTAADLAALARVLNMAIDNSCSCQDSDGKGYEGHDSNYCHVHSRRADLKRVASIIAKAEGASS